jgi:hypothetical protein
MSIFSLRKKRRAGGKISGGKIFGFFPPTLDKSIVMCYTEVLIARLKNIGKGRA